MMKPLYLQRKGRGTGVARLRSLSAPLEARRCRVPPAPLPSLCSTRPIGDEVPVGITELEKCRVAPVTPSNARQQPRTEPRSRCGLAGDGDTPQRGAHVAHPHLRAQPQSCSHPLNSDQGKLTPCCRAKFPFKDPPSARLAAEAPKAPPGPQCHVPVLQQLGCAMGSGTHGTHPGCPSPGQLLGLGTGRGTGTL